MSRRFPLAVLSAFLPLLLLTAAAQAQTTWVAAEPLPGARFEASGVAVNGKVYIFGGFDDLPGWTLVATPETVVYDGAAGTWSHLASIPTPDGAGLTHTGLAVEDDRFVWIAGGFLGDDPGAAVDTVYRYDLVADAWSEGPRLPAARGGGGLCRVGRTLHFIGGVMADRNTNAGDHYVLDLDHPEAGWRTAAPLPTPRNHFSIVVLDGRVFTVGGQFNHDVNPQDVDVVEVYQPGDDSWSAAASLPRVRSHFEPGTFIRDGRIVIAGGKSGDAAQIADITQYDPVDDSWIELSPLPADLRAAVVQPVGSRVVIAGGGVVNGYTPAAGVFVGNLEPAAGGWATHAPLGPWREDTGVAAAGGKVYVMGGHDASGTRLDTVAVYDPADDSWSSIDPVPGPPRDSIGVVSVDDRLYAIGGLTGWPGPSVADVYMFDTANPAAGWTPRAPLPAARGGMGVAAIGGRIYAAGGLSGQVQVADVTVYDPDTDSWSAAAPMPTPRAHLAAAAIDGRLFAAGGLVFGGSEAVAANEIYDPATDTWSAAAPMQTPRAVAASAVFDGRLFVFGGYTSTGIADTNEAYDPALDTWRTATPMPAPRAATGAAVVGGRAIVPGGRVPGGSQEQATSVSFAVDRPAHVLVVTHTEEFRHDSIPVAEATIAMLGQRSGLFTTSFCRTAEDVARMLTPAGLATVDAIVFANTTGHLPVPDVEALMAWIAAGHAFVGLHAASDTYHDVASYKEMLGNEFLEHGTQSTVSAVVENRSHPAVSHLGERFTVFDEIYRFARPNRGEVTMLLSLDEYPPDGLPAAGEPGDLPLAWSKSYGTGRVFYTALGHRDDVWQSAAVQQHILGGLQWVLRR